MEYEFNLLYYINTYKKWWKSILKLMIIVMFLTALSSFLVQPNYISTVTIISAESSGLSSLSSLNKILGIPAFGIGGSFNDIILAILKSKRMEKDISNFLELNKQVKFKYSISAVSITSGLIINVIGNDPAYTEKVANFAVQDLDKINGELNITPSKPMVKVLDSASYGIKGSRQIFKKVFVAGLAAFLLMSLYIFFSDYLRRLKE